MLDYSSLLLTLVLAESSIERVPPQIFTHSAVRASARRKGKPVAQILLDQSYHHAAIARLGKAWNDHGRGRPDIVHLSLLLALGSPLNQEGKLKCYVHTREDMIIEVNPATRLPRNTDRFVSLIEQLYAGKVVPPSGTPLLQLNSGRISDLRDRLKSDYVVALSTVGEPRKLDEVARLMSRHQRPILLVGGFSHGHLSSETLQHANDVYKVYRTGLDAWTIVSRAIYDYERAIGLDSE